jgi:hypothetical protein
VIAFLTASMSLCAVRAKRCIAYKPDFQPRAEFTDALAFEHASKSHGESTHGGEFWPILFQRIDFRSLIGGQHSPRLDAERRSHGDVERPVAGSTGLDSEQPLWPSNSPSCFSDCAISQKVAQGLKSFLCNRAL